MKKFTFSQAIAILLFFFIALPGSTIKCQDLQAGFQSSLLINNELDSLILASIAAINPDSIENTMLQMQNLTTRFMLAPNRKQVAQWMQARFESVGCEVTSIDSFQTHTTISVNNIFYDTTTWQYNVMATIEGHLNPGKITAIGGHYDCFTHNNPFDVAPGADDNASSVATIIELARVINSSGYVPNKTIRFLALGAEELMNYSSMSGARDYANKWALNKDDLQVYINNDMIANEPAETDWIVDFLVHDLEYWTTPLTVTLSQAYSSLTANVMEQGNFGADDLPFWQAGFQTAYFFEHNFSPFYHTENDLVENCNIAYCSEVARLNMALLLSVTELPEPMDNFYMYASGDGQTLQAVWKPLDETDIDEYLVKFGTSPDALLQSFSTSDTALLFSGLHPDTVYYASLSAKNSRGNLSPPVLRKARPAVVTLDQGILVVAGSQGGLFDPPQEEIDQFYNKICHNFNHESFDASLVEELQLAEIGKYSTLLWHIDNPDWTNSILPTHLDILRNYLYLGGHLMFTGFKPARMFGTQTYPAVFREGSFVYDCLKIKTSNNEAARFFAGADPVDPEWPALYVDSVKMPAFNYHMPWVEVFDLAGDGEVVYRYDTKYDTLSNQGAYYNHPVGVCQAGPDKQTFTLGFPLFYMDSLQSCQLVYHVMTNLFGETYLDVADFAGNPISGMRVFPNPANDKVKFEFREKGSSSLEIHILDISGRELQRLNTGQSQSAEWDVRNIPSGIYLYKVIFAGSIETGKIVVKK